MQDGWKNVGDLSGGRGWVVTWCVTSTVKVSLGAPGQKNVVNGVLRVQILCAR